MKPYRDGIVGHERMGMSKPGELPPNFAGFDPFQPIEVFEKALELHYQCKNDVDEEFSRMLFRDLVNLTIGFGELARRTHISSKSLHRMLSKRGNPTSRNMAAIICALQNALNVSILVQVRPNE